MADNVVSRKQDGFLSVCTAPDVCKTPMGGSTPPVPYQVTAEMKDAKAPSGDVRANEKYVHKDDKTYMPVTKGDEPGTAKGVKSGTVGEQSWNAEKSDNVQVNGLKTVRVDDKTEMNGTKKGDEAEKKAQRYKCRKEQIEAGKKSDDPATRQAADRFARNNVAAERAALADHTYDPKQPAPTGWRDVSGDEAALRRHGLTPDDLDRGRAGATRLYEPDRGVFGDDMRPTLGFRGTQETPDWGQNFRQGLDAESGYYRNAVGLGSRLGSSVDYTGHSLGGGLASAAATAGGGTGTTFNAAGLHPNTVSHYGGQVRPANLDAYRVDNEPLTGAQEQGWKSTLLGGWPKVLASAKMPDALGTPRDLPATSWGPKGKHSMSDVKKGIEKQKQEDQAKIAAKTGKKC